MSALASRRRFLGTSMALAAAPFGLAGEPGTSEREPRHFAALRRATPWVGASPAPPEWRGRVVLVHFGTYTCINWLRTLPYVRAWSRTYPDLVVIGVHTPEFAFEQRLENVRRIVAQLKVDHPLAIDNDFAIWRAFDNHYWPASYFIDARGRIRDRHAGEGAYEESERTIRKLLAEAGLSGSGTGGALEPIAATGFEMQADWPQLQSPETYLGSARTERFASRGGTAPGQRRFTAPSRLALNEWALTGQWTMTDASVAVNEAAGRIVFRFHARDVHLVMGPLHEHTPVRCRVSLDGQRPGPACGSDIDADGAGTIADQRLYQLVRQPGPIEDRTFEIEFLDAGAEAFAFTFG